MLKKELSGALDAAAGQLSASLINYRRDFHRHAESGWCEFRTASLVARRLTDLGYSVMTGKDVINSRHRTGLPPAEVLRTRWNRARDQGGDVEYLQAMRGGYTAVAAISGDGKSPHITLRFDMDALEIPERASVLHRPFREGFASVNRGESHACGHDGHTAAGLGVAEILMRLKKHLRGSVLLVFQPAEEGVRGAKAVAGSGILDTSEFILAHHLFSDYETGTIIPGLSKFAATEKLDIHINGKPSHAGANPEAGENALLAAATAVLNLHAIPRHGGGWTRINVGKLAAGTERNIIPDHAHLLLETRGETDGLNAFIRERAIRIIKSAAAMHRCSARIIRAGSAPGAASDTSLVSRIAGIAPAMNLTCIDDSKSGISEDFTWMMKQVQGTGGQAAMIGIGAHPSASGKNKNEHRYPAHTPEFDFNETALLHAVRLITAVTLDLMHDPSPHR